MNMAVSSRTNRRFVAGVALLAAVAAAPALGARSSPLAPARTVPLRADGAEYILTIDDGPATFAVSAPARSQLEVAPGSSITSALYPSFAAIEGTFLPSLELCRWRGWAFEEGALAAAELKLDEPVGPLAAGRAGFLNALALKLNQAYDADKKPAFADALAFVATALALSRADGKVPPELGLPADVANQATADRDSFTGKDAVARVTAGRYGWDEGLNRLYLVNRWLARDFPQNEQKQFEAALALAWAVQADPALASQYGFYEGLYRGLGGWPADRAGVADYNALLKGRDAPSVLKELGTVRALQSEARAKGTAFVFVPAPGEAEVELIRREAARGANLSQGWTEAAIAAVNGGAIAGKPAPDGSWYDYQAYAWAALLTPAGLPEAKKLVWDDGYKKRLAESYRFGFDQTRSRAAPAPAGTALTGLAAYVNPDFRLEPLPEYYLRMARSYARLEKALAAAFPPPAGDTLRGRREKGNAAESSLLAEAGAMRDMFFGFYLLSCADLGMAPAVAGGEVADRNAAAARAEQWLNNWKTDPDMAADVREAYPLGLADAAAPDKGVVYRCVLGVRAVDVEVKYEGKPATRLSGTSRTASLHLKPTKYTVLVPEVVEVTVAGEKPLTRAEFRKICDKNKTRDAILATLKDYGKPPPPPPPPPPKKKTRKYDRGMLALLGVLAIFMLVIFIVIIAGRRRSLYQ